MSEKTESTVMLPQAEYQEIMERLSSLQADNDRLRGEVETHKLALDFFGWWWNKGGANTGQGYDDYVAQLQDNNNGPK